MMHRLCLRMDVEAITEEKKKQIMDFGLGEEQPERVTVEVLKDLIAEKPDKMSRAARSWLCLGRRLKLMIV